MTVTVTLELKFKPDEVSAARELFGRVLQDTRAFDGNERTDVLIDADDEVADRDDGLRHERASGSGPVHRGARRRRS